MSECIRQLSAIFANRTGAHILVLAKSYYVVNRGAIAFVKVRRDHIGFGVAELDDFGFIILYCV